MAEETLERHTSYGRGGAGNLRKAHRPVFLSLSISTSSGVDGWASFSSTVMSCDKRC